MARNFTKTDIINWTEVIYNPENDLIREISLNWSEYEKIYIDQIAESLYEDMRR